MVGYSVKNRRFTTEFFSHYFKLCQAIGLKGIVAVFDEPYAFNDAAEMGLTLPSECMLTRTRKTGDERARMVTRIRDRCGANTTPILRWQELSSSSLVTALRDELVCATYSNPRLRSDLISQTIARLVHRGFVDAEYFLNFQFQEIPVLFALYYHENYLIDIYPGENFPIFQQVEDGQWAGELPLASSLCSDKRLTFINVGALSVP